MSVISRRESGARGNAVMRSSRYPKRVTDAWARMGGRKPNLTYYQILEIEREQKASARAKARSSSQRRSASAFDSTT